MVNSLPRTLNPIEPGKDPQVLPDPQIHRQVHTHGRKIHATQYLDAMSFKLLTEDFNSPGCRANQPQNYMQGRRLSSPVRAQKPYDLAARDTEAQVIYRRQPIEHLRQLMHAQNYGAGY
jgi:hypothetical protein